MTDLECPRCGGAVRAWRCEGCGATFPHVLGVPFLGDFEAADALGLIEIAANARNRGNLAIEPEEVARIDALCAAYHQAQDKAAFVAGNPGAQVSWFGNRYSEWQAIEALLEGHDLKGRSVLDIGAGQGFDSWRLALRGAVVTALEFNPIVAEAGLQSFPSLRWIGGFAHALPFRAASFDYVFINAALHHMRDIPVSIAEALRVLRPGGSLITSSDPFRADDAGQQLEFDIFDRHEAVLLGINEQIPKASDFLTVLEHNRAILEPEIFTSVLYGGRLGNEPTLTDWTGWDLDADGSMLKARAGSVAMRVRLLAPWPHARAAQRYGILSPETFVDWLQTPARAVAQLASIIPSELIDTPFPGSPTKFDLLNGWRVARSTETTRTGYRRARLFRTRGTATELRFQLRSPVPADFTFRLNAEDVASARIATEWTSVTVDLAAMPVGKPFVLEIQRQGEPSEFDAGCFEVGAVATRTPLKVRWRNLLPAFLRPRAGFG